MHPIGSGVSLTRNLVVLTLCVSTTTMAQETLPSPVATPPLYSEQTLSELRKLQKAAFTSDYAHRQVAHLCNNIGPRLSGSPQAQKAVDYVAAEMKALGLDVRIEKVVVPHWVRGEETAALVEFPGQAPETTQKLVLTALGGSVATPAEGLTAEVIAVKDFDELQALPRDAVRGKIVVFDHAYDKAMAAQGRGGEAYGEAVAYRSDTPSAAARMGGVAALIRSVGSADYRLPHTGQTKYADDAPKIPAGALAAEDAELVANLAAQGKLRMRLVLTPQQLPDVDSFNVVADLKGSTKPEQVVIVSGHLDSWDLGTGAIDDAAGVAVSMETLNLVKKAGLHPRRTIRMIAWMNEENGLRGGSTYAQDHKAEMANHFAAIETDGGAGHPVGMNLKAKPEVKTWLKPIAKVLQSSGAGLLNLVEHTGADVSPMEEFGVPTFHPMQDSRSYFEYHHTAADTFDKVDPHQLQENAAVVAVTAYGLANLEQPLPR